MDFLLRLLISSVILGLPAYVIGFLAHRGRRVSGRLGALIGVSAGMAAGLVLGIGQDETLRVVAPIVIGLTYGLLAGAYSSRAVEIDDEIGSALNRGDHIER